MPLFPPHPLNDLLRVTIHPVGLRNLLQRLVVGEVVQRVPLPEVAHRELGEADEADGQGPRHAHADVIALVADAVVEAEQLMDVLLVDEQLHRHHHAEAYLVLAPGLHPSREVVPQAVFIRLDEPLPAAELERVAHRPAVDEAHEAGHPLQIYFHIFVRADAAQHHALQHPFLHIIRVRRGQVRLPITFGNLLRQLAQVGDADAEDVRHAGVEALGEGLVALLGQAEEFGLDGLGGDGGWLIILRTHASIH